MSFGYNLNMAKKKTNVLLLIDASALIHRFFYALPPLTTPKNEPIGAIFGLANVMLKIIREQTPQYIAACFDRPEPTFRDELFKEYKIQRPKPTDELISQIQKMRSMFEAFDIPVVEKAGFEADDIIGTLAEKFKNADVTTRVLTGDNDLLQLVDDKNNIEVQIIRKGLADAKIYNESEVEKRFGVKPTQLVDYKGIVGDASDNIPGIKGVGPKTLVPLLKKFKNIEGIYENLQSIPEKIRKKLEGQKENALFYRKIVTIRKDVPIDVSLQDLKLGKLNKEKLIKYFNELGFKSLVQRLQQNEILTSTN